MNLKKIFLIFSSFTVCIIALLYGVSPSWFFTTFLVDSQSVSIDQSHILRAVMMLYISLGIFWLYCAFSDKYRDIGIIIICIFCTGLVSGRLLSIIIDGIPSPLLIVYIFMEVSIIPVSIWLLKYYKEQ